MATHPRRDWTIDEVFIAMNVYGRLSFGQLHQRNPLILQVADRLGRTPSALAMKLCNLASLDPEVRKKGTKGLTGASALDREVWSRFETDSFAAGVRSEQLFNGLFDTEDGTSAEAPCSEPPPTRAADARTERDTEAKARLGQAYFRRVVLVSYGTRCCISDLPIPQLLTASHILPWADFERERLNPRNGLCLAKTQDAAFDQHLITLDEDLRLVVGKQIRAYFSSEAIAANFSRYEGKPIRSPTRFVPDPRFLSHHQESFSKVNR